MQVFLCHFEWIEYKWAHLESISDSLFKPQNPNSQVFHQTTQVFRFIVQPAKVFRERISLCCVKMGSAWNRILVAQQQQTSVYLLDTAAEMRLISFRANDSFKPARLRKSLAFLTRTSSGIRSKIDSSSKDVSNDSPKASKSSSSSSVPSASTP